MSLTLTLRASRLIKAPRSRVWDVFCRETGWPLPQVSLEPLDRIPPDIHGRNHRPTLTLRPLSLPLQVRARVLMSQPCRRVAWRARWLGITSRHAYTFSDALHGTILESVETLEGWTLLPARIIFSPKRLGLRSQKWLECLASQAEDRG